MKRFRNTRYLITETGKVWSEKHNRFIISHDYSGYLRLRIFIDKKAQYFSVHRLVAEVYLENPNNYPVVNHIDGNKQNNDYTNLEWCTSSQNFRHAMNSGLIKFAKGESQGSSKLTEEQVKSIRNIYKLKQYTLTEIGIMFNVTYSAIHLIVKNKAWKHVKEDV